ncbi:hypothetical protein SERLADRAFT_432782 [Serpula lacrymans var. lacrymans S7.9]|uniref:Uncharacterized protein n=1 Tax=Serpula lacrymans var. lacrymans (strain S7.9) TaxID=578457 RepID=F8NEX7_SERL9|nr:uncharacterized protein SERLADRAFT_432782 [Serpula lacrymans var. lacrymans S7.9]EGO31125.1 hypothetical protein SERLADRAFT_432782 [Serpula lacrymans var. lacrymans S7.9]
MSHIPRTTEAKKGPWCKYCQQHRSTQRFDKHIKSCKVRNQEQLELAARQENHSEKRCLGRSLEEPNQKRKKTVEVLTSLFFNFLNLQFCASYQADGDRTQVNDEVEAGPPISAESGNDETNVQQISSATFIQVVHHPQSGKHDPVIIPLDSVIPSADQGNHEAGLGSALEIKPWAPFRNRADFEYAETAVKGLLSKAIVNTQLYGIHHGWADNTNITFRNYADIEKTLQVARAQYVQFQEGNVSACYLGETHYFKFQYRDPWKIYRNWIMDETLAPLILWHPCRKYYCRRNGRIVLKERIYDEFNSANKWWDVQESFPQEEPPHCFLPISLWLDKGNITKRVKKHPIIIRPLFLPRGVRNASGNGGGVLVGYMPIPLDPADPSDRNTADTIKWQCFKREVYHKVAEVIFHSLRWPARFGEAMACGDKIDRVIHPGIPVKSVDGEESCALTATRAALAKFPCPKCLVCHDSLTKLCGNFQCRTTDNMEKVYKRSITASNKTEAERILQAHGLHATKNFFWSLDHSDPYCSISYDKLHSDDLGKWGKHIWPLLLTVLAENGNKGHMARNMRNVSRWPGLKHFMNVTTVEYADGQVFYDILKCILPCIVQILPRNSTLVHGIRAYARYRLMIGLNCMTEGRTHRLKQYIIQYEQCCEHISNNYEKDFHFSKQHAINHILTEIRQKGATDNYDTRVSEGFHQEAQEAYEQTNRKDTDSQMARIDENPRSHRPHTDDRDDAGRNDDQRSTQPTPDNHWMLGSPTNLTSSVVMEHCEGLKGFDKRLRSFLVSSCNVAVGDGPISIRKYQCIYLKYQSHEDWSEGRDILRCNPNFNKESRFDCVLINTDTSEPVPARLQTVFRCFLQSSSFDIVSVKIFKPSNGIPRTRWSGALLYDEARDFKLVMAKSLIRGAHMIEAFDLKEGRFYLNDLIDGDMFLRFGN